MGVQPHGLGEIRLQVKCYRVVMATRFDDGHRTASPVRGLLGLSRAWRARISGHSEPHQPTPASPKRSARGEAI